MPALVTLFSKPGCHLCEELRQELEDTLAGHDVRLEEVDITRDPALFDRYRYEIPVVLVDGVEAGRGRIDPAAVRDRCGISRA